ncbi:hypothetical protein V1264_014503 [Littorina saxatilis]|uniref:Uncharacterized protein n=1 Tax=Littorina saxatilis TaxID=31220 RepID=A0AAN9BRA4_9CAEN
MFYSTPETSCVPAVLVWLQGFYGWSVLERQAFKHRSVAVGESKPGETNDTGDSMSFREKDASDSLPGRKACCWWSV